MIDSPESEAAESEPACMICGEGLCEGAASGIVICANCETPHHQDCWAYHGHCAVYGCGSYRSQRAGSSWVQRTSLVMDPDAERQEPVYRVSGGMSGTDAAHLSIVLFPLLWLPAAVDGGWLLALNLLFIGFPLLMFAFQVRTLTVRPVGLKLGYLLWSRTIPWEEIRSFGPDPMCGYSLGMDQGALIAVPAEPGELRELEASIRRHLRQLSIRRS